MVVMILSDFYSYSPPSSNDDSTLHKKHGCVIPSRQVHGTQLFFPYFMA